MKFLQHLFGASVQDRIQDRADGIDKWLAENGDACKAEQLHTVAGTKERIYWHYGYMVALRDVLRLFTSKQAKLN